MPTITLTTAVINRRGAARRSVARRGGALQPADPSVSRRSHNETDGHRDEHMHTAIRTDASRRVAFAYQ